MVANFDTLYISSLKIKFQSLALFLTEQLHLIYETLWLEEGKVK